VPDSVVEVLVTGSSVVEVATGTPGAPGIGADPATIGEAVEDYLTENPPPVGAHTHVESDVTGLTAALAGKASTTHTHAQADVTGLVDALAGKQAAGSYAAATHTHAEGDVTGLTAALAGKSATGHTHTAAGVTDFAAAVAAVELSIAGGSANNPHTTEAAARNASLPKNFWQYTGTAGVNDPDNWIAGDEWISA